MRALLGLTVGAFILSLPAFAGEGEVYPSDVRTITATEATSECINDPKTPVCAVETFLACIARVDHGLCAKVGQRLVSITDAEDLRYQIELVCYSTNAEGLYADVIIRNHNRAGDLYHNWARLTDHGWQVLENVIEGLGGPVDWGCAQEPPRR